MNFVLAAMRLHDVRTNEGDPPPVGIERLVSAVELLAHRSDLEVAPFVQAWDPLVDALEIGESRSSVAVRAFARSVLQVNEATVRRRQTILNQAANHLEQAIRDFSRPTTTPAFGRLHAWLTRRLVMDLVVSDETNTYYLSPFLELARDEGALIATLNYDLTLEICAAAANIPLNRMVNSWARTGALTVHTSGIPYLKLHGSVDWTTTNGDDLHVGHQTGNERMPALVYGQREKLRSAGPFLQLLESFRRNLSEADRLIVSGYSFGDEHVNAIIRRWMRARHEGKLLVVDPGFPELYGYGRPQLDLWHEYGAGAVQQGSIGAESEHYVQPAQRMFVRREGFAEFAGQLGNGSEALFANSGITSRERESIGRAPRRPTDDAFRARRHG
ncbi:hypothetical protein J2Y66_003634 [Paenarthrobacter nitroguajacolicus]|uniref:SIR2 family protein n=1 Tax=Paenarthrobacter nitroguajacolicus TaxID=211146 RepID=UPI00285AE719|nr:SIR2 family protein [Paenarthrobacter nitroguajacolicus]MDR6989119.1 hypothetical protein [Paenarthrobacter nitroguajacolicus]